MSDVYVFTMLDCEHCNDTKERLVKEEINFIDLDIVLYQEIWDKIVEKTGSNVVPTLMVVKEGESEATIYSPNTDFQTIDEIVTILKNE